MVLTVSYLTLLNHQATQIHGDKLTGDHMIELHPKNRFVSKFFLYHYCILDNRCFALFYRAYTSKNSSFFFLLMVQYFKVWFMVSFIGGGNRSTPRENHRTGVSQ